MNDQLATIEHNGAIAPSRDRIAFDDEKLAIITNHICKNATPAELEFFLATCQRRGFDPIAKQIYFIKYGNNPATFVVSIDALRLTADRTRHYAPGQAAIYETDANGALVSATAFVKKKVGQEWHVTSETAYLVEFFVANNPKWKTMPRVMLSKAAEARALRRAFPEDLSGLYVREEIDQAEMTSVSATVVSSEIGPPVGRQRLPRAVATESTLVVEDNLAFKTGENVGKTPAECDTEYLEKCLNAWKNGSKYRPEMKVEVERVLMGREKKDAEAYGAARAAEEELPKPKPEAKKGTASPKTVEAPPEATDRITDAQFGAIKSYGTRLYGANEYVKVLHDSLGKPVGQLSQIEAADLIHKMQKELGVENATAPDLVLTPETAPSSDSPSLRALMSSIKKAHLSMAPEDRDARLVAINKYLADTNVDESKPAPFIKSTTELPNDVRFNLAGAIERGEVTWGQPVLDGVLVEDVPDADNPE